MIQVYTTDRGESISAFHHLLLTGQHQAFAYLGQQGQLEEVDYHDLPGPGLLALVIQLYLDPKHAKNYYETHQENLSRESVLLCFRSLLELGIHRYFDDHQLIYKLLETLWQTEDSVQDNEVHVVKLLEILYQHGVKLGYKSLGQMALRKGCLLIGPYLLRHWGATVIQQFWRSSR